MLRLKKLKVGNKIIEVINIDKSLDSNYWLTVQEVKETGILLSNKIFVPYHEKSWNFL